ncbi:MAG: DoxX family membrane protein, partial [Lewinella sp.]|nr:DoxX family membrane protein [Lewinella sp.]
MSYTKPQVFFLSLLRIFIGWHFLFEGLTKVFNPGWTAKGYLLSSQGIFASLFKSLGESSLLGVVNVMTIILLLFVGLTLILGIFERWGAYAGMLLLAFFYLSHPSWPGLEAAGPAEGNYWIVNKNLIEFFALGVLALFPTGRRIGLDVFRSGPAASTVS